jgi:DNA polymerase I-like protein with 3'-5' exonuclease and polymerase domains
MNIKGPFQKIDFVDFNLDSSDQTKSYLLSVGWIPTTYNRVFDKNTRSWRTTSPKLTEDSFDSISDDTGKLLARRAILCHRRRFIENFKDPENKGLLAYIRPDGRVAARGNLCGTPTARTTHSAPVCNVPKAKDKIVYGKELRSLFCVEDGYVMLGADLDQIEARITAHYASIFDQGEYAEYVLDGDIHQRNADLIGRDRDTAKSFQYALFYGARDAKIATICQCSVSKGGKLIQQFWEGNKGVKELVDYIEKYFDEYGFIKALDGRKLLIRAKYKLLNSLIQTGAALIFKKWGILANKRLREAGLYCRQILAFHDEYSYRCLPEHANQAAEIISQAALDAGIFFNIKVPITTNVKMGRNWSEIH